MQKVYTTTLAAAKSDTQHMKAPRTSTLNFIRNFARAYSYTPETGALILN